MTTTCYSETTDLAFVSVVMPVRNEEKHIAATLQQIIHQQREGIELEVIVIDGRSTDRTREIVREFCQQHPEVRLLDNPRKLSSAARNIGIRHSSGNYVLIVDGHCEIPSSSYLRDMVNAFESTNADCLGRPQPLNVTDASTVQLAVAIARSTWLGHHPDSFIYSEVLQEVPAASVAVAYRREVFHALGVFDERFDACEDGEFNYRIDAARMRCVFDPRLRINYTPRDSLSALFRQLYRYGRGRVRLARKHPATFSWKTFLPAAFAAGLAIGPLASAFEPILWWPYLIILATYVVVLIASSCHCAWRHGKWQLLFWLPLVFPTIHFGAAAGSIWELVRPFESQREPERQSSLTALHNEAAK